MQRTAVTNEHSVRVGRAVGRSVALAVDGGCRSEAGVGTAAARRGTDEATATMTTVEVEVQREEEKEAVCVCVCACACVRVEERGRGRGG